LWPKNSKIFTRNACKTLFFVVLVLFVACIAPIQPVWGESVFTIAVDAGHSRNNPGAYSARKVGEHTFNSRIAGLLVDELKKHKKFKPVLINETGADISLKKRVELIKEAKPDLLVSIHHDSVQPAYLSKWIWNGWSVDYSDRYSGFSLFYSEKNKHGKKSLRLALLLGNALLDKGLRPSLHHAEKIKGENRELVDKEKGVYRYDNLVVLRSAACPAVLVECGIIKNRRDEVLLSSAPYQQKIVEALQKAISDFVGSTDCIFNAEPADLGGAACANGGGGCHCRTLCCPAAGSRIATHSANGLTGSSKAYRLVAQLPLIDKVCLRKRNQHFHLDCGVSIFPVSIRLLTSIRNRDLWRG